MPFLVYTCLFLYRDVIVDVPTNITRTTIQERCCDGWMGHNCSQAICTPSCQNGGKCKGPNTCECVGYTGEYCQFRKSLQHLIFLKLNIELDVLLYRFEKN